MLRSPSDAHILQNEMPGLMHVREKVLFSYFHFSFSLVLILSSVPCSTATQGCPYCRMPPHVIYRAPIASSSAHKNNLGPFKPLSSSRPSPPWALKWRGPPAYVLISLRMIFNQTFIVHTQNIYSTQNHAAAAYALIVSYHS